ncbi:DUF6122 family protein [Sphingobacterium spiritivorum]|uniref:DUF6122 family protein n=1 Tax=Sphingobacterium spiritivorum TaxID=258 RepID=UPI003DA35335
MDGYLCTKLIALLLFPKLEVLTFIFDLKTIVHYTLHFLFPGIIAIVFYKKEWKSVWILLLLTMLVDIDHLFAEPIFDPDRCSIGFHFLHSYYAIAVYACLFLFGNKIIRIIALGLLFHMVTDFQDCLW